MKWVRISSNHCSNWPLWCTSRWVYPSQRCRPRDGKVAKKLEMTAAHRGIPHKSDKITVNGCIKAWWVHATIYFVDLCWILDKKWSENTGIWAIIDAARRERREVRCCTVIQPRSQCSCAKGTEALATCTHASGWIWLSTRWVRRW